MDALNFKLLQSSKIFIKLAQELKIEPYSLPEKHEKDLPQEYWQDFSHSQVELDPINRLILARKLNKKIRQDLPEAIKDQLLIQLAWKQAQQQNKEYLLGLDLKRPETISEAIELLDFVEDKITEILEF